MEHNITIVEKKKKISLDLKQSIISGEIKNNEIDAQHQHIKELLLTKIELNNQINKTIKNKTNETDVMKTISIDKEIQFDQE